MKEDYLILVDLDDNQIGTMEKMQAHKKALLHRAISVFICNSNDEWLLQRRALNKYHSGGLWTNTTCSHPFPGELSIDAANRRLMEEMGMECDLLELFSFTYNAALDKGLTEHEYDHVFFGISDEIPKINAEEVMEWKYLSYNDLHQDMMLNPGNYTVWFKIIFERVNQHVTNYIK